jgi:hypothetical protein
MRKEEFPLNASNVGHGKGLTSSSPPNSGMQRGLPCCSPNDIDHRA